MEQRIVDLAVRRSTTPRPQLLPSVTKLVLATKPGLSGEQRAAVHRLLTGERLVDCLIAAAGSGKTYSLNLAREMWEGSHYRVIGASLAARAAKELEEPGAHPVTHDRQAADRPRPWHREARRPDGARNR